MRPTRIESYRMCIYRTELLFEGAYEQVRGSLSILGEWCAVQIGKFTGCLNRERALLHYEVEFLARGSLEWLPYAKGLSAALADKIYWKSACRYPTVEWRIVEVQTLEGVTSEAQAEEAQAEAMANPERIYWDEHATS